MSAIAMSGSSSSAYSPFARAATLPQAVPQDAIDAIAAHLKVLASDSRLALLSSLRTPKTLDEILLAPSDARADSRPDRAVSRQAVQRHLDSLLEAGLVIRRLTRRGVSRSGYEYLLDHTRVFAVVEEMRRLTSYRSNMSADLVQTQEAPAVGGGSWTAGAKLVIVHGVREGHVFPLEAKEAGEPSVWSIGRAEDADAAVVYDPFVSFENAEIVRTSSGYRLRDLGSAKNGTSLNWQRLPPGGDVPLQTGDIIGVGRSLLVFRER